MPNFFVLSNINYELLFLAPMVFGDQIAFLSCKGPSSLLSSAFYPHPQSCVNDSDSSLSYYFSVHTGMFHSVKGQGRMGIDVEIKIVNQANKRQNQ